MREIVLDTETTGLKVEDGDQVIEIGCVEVINRVRTGNHYHSYLNVPKESSPGALEVHGLTTEFLSDKPKFKDVVNEFLDFLQDSPLVIHNAKFDLKFLNNELDLINLPKLSNNIVDTLIVARRKFPGSPANLDALCKRFNIDGSKRVKHGALLDAELLADVYLELTGGSQISLDLTEEEKASNNSDKIVKENFPIRKFPVSEEELDLHEKMLEDLKDNIWN